MDWTYYKSGGVKTLKYPSQGTRETVTYTYDARTQRPATLTSGAFTAPIVAAASWTTQGAPDAQTWGDATSSDKIDVDWIYDSDTLRLSSLKAGKNTYTGNIQHLVYDYDRNSNITSILDKQNSDQYQCFTYDWLNRLESAYTDDDCAGSVVATGDGNYDDDFDYDSLGNVKPVGEGYVYGAGAAGPHAVTSANGWTFTYDSNGNQATRVHPGGTRTDTLTFDVNNRLTSYEVDSGGLAADTGFVYDADGSRVAVIADSGDATHYISGIHTHDVAAGIEENSYTFSGVTVGLNDDGVRHHVFTDHLATVTATLEYGLAVANVERLRYSPFGDKRGSTGVVAGDRTYTGQVDDMTVTGLMFYNARYYDPVARNFVSPDTIIPDPASTPGWNRYAYVNNNPINYNDPSGHDACPGGGGGCYYGDHTERSYLAAAFSLISDTAEGIKVQTLPALVTYNSRSKTYRMDVFEDGAVVASATASATFSRREELGTGERPIKTAYVVESAPDFLKGLDPAIVRQLSSAFGVGTELLSVGLVVTEGIDIYESNSMASRQQAVESVLAYSAENIAEYSASSLLAGFGAKACKGAASIVCSVGAGFFGELWVDTSIKTEVQAFYLIVGSGSEPLSWEWTGYGWTNWMREPLFK